MQCYDGVGLGAVCVIEWGLFGSQPAIAIPKSHDSIGRSSIEYCDFVQSYRESYYLRVVSGAVISALEGRGENDENHSVRIKS